jgi:hypothetical protein
MLKQLLEAKNKQAGAWRGGRSGGEGLGVRPRARAAGRAGGRGARRPPPPSLRRTSQAPHPRPANPTPPPTPQVQEHTTPAMGLKADLRRIKLNTTTFGTRCGPRGARAPGSRAAAGPFQCPACTPGTAQSPPHPHPTPTPPPPTPPHPTPTPPPPPHHMKGLTPSSSTPPGTSTPRASRSSSCPPATGSPGGSRTWRGWTSRPLPPTPAACSCEG